MTTADSAPGASGGVHSLCARHGNDPAALLEILHDLQEEAGCVPRAAIADIAQALNLSRADVLGVVTFYHDFREAPAGRVTVRVCRAEACQAVGALALIERICARRGVTLGETAIDGSVTIEPVYCLGNCALGPAVLVDGALHGRLDAARLDALIDARLREAAR